jgi:osmotically-inducible protein OsmY
MHSPLRYALILCALALPPLLSSCAPLVFAGGATAISAAHDRRTAGSQLDDQSIELKSSKQLSDDADLRQNAHVNITSYNGLVLVTGETTTNEQRERVVGMVRGIAGVRRIVNDLRVTPPSPFSARTQDTWITSKVKSKLIGVEGLDSLQVKVITENSVVYLMGLVTQKEAELAANAITELSGIERIVKLFEYVDDTSRVQNRP